MKLRLPFAEIEIRPRGLTMAKLEARWMRWRAEIVEPSHPEESHCDQCDLQGVCDYLHDRKRNYADCRAFPRVYRRRRPRGRPCLSVS